MLNGRLFGWIWLGSEEENKVEENLRLVVGFLECDFEEFQDYLENVHEIEGTEAERIIASLEGMIQNGTTKSN